MSLINSGREGVSCITLCRGRRKPIPQRRFFGFSYLRDFGKLSSKTGAAKMTKFSINNGNFSISELLETLGEIVLSKSKAKCEKKQIYYSPKTATRAAYSLEEKKPNHTYDVYRCRWCSFYHLGHSWDSEEK